jgi:hypothetical protein
MRHSARSTSSLGARPPSTACRSRSPPRLASSPPSNSPPPPHSTLSGRGCATAPRASQIAALVDGGRRIWPAPPRVTAAVAAEGRRRPRRGGLQHPSPPRVAGGLDRARGASLRREKPSISCSISSSLSHAPAPWPSTACGVPVRKQMARRSRRWSLTPRRSPIGRVHSELIVARVM